MVKIASAMYVAFRALDKKICYTKISLSKSKRIVLILILTLKVGWVAHRCIHVQLLTLTNLSEWKNYQSLAFMDVFSQLSSVVTMYCIACCLDIMYSCQHACASTCTQ